MGKGIECVVILEGGIMLDREQILEQIAANAAYYDTHANPNARNEDGSAYRKASESAAGSAFALREILKQAEEYDEPHDVLKQAVTDEELKNW